jgi:hypothetical protein
MNFLNAVIFTIAKKVLRKQVEQDTHDAYRFNPDMFFYLYAFILRGTFFGASHTEQALVVYRSQ